MPALTTASTSMSTLATTSTTTTMHTSGSSRRIPPVRELSGHSLVRPCGLAAPIGQGSLVGLRHRSQAQRVKLKEVELHFGGAGDPASCATCTLLPRRSTTVINAVTLHKLVSEFRAAGAQQARTQATRQGSLDTCAWKPKSSKSRL